MPQTLESLQEDYLVALALHLSDLTLKLNREANEGKRYRIKVEIDETIAELIGVKQRL